MIQIADDPIIRSMERTGYPPWYPINKGERDYDEEDDFGCEDEFYGNETEGF